MVERSNHDRSVLRKHMECIVISLNDMKQRYDDIRRTISGAAERSGRSTESIRIVGITKTWPRETVELAIEAGIRDIGENRVQEALAKLPPNSTGVRYHLVGHLQRNKVRKAVRIFDVIHSLDSIDIGRTIARIAGENNRTIDALIQVNVGEDEAKYGVECDDVFPVIRELQSENGIRVIGLMTIGPLFDDPEESRPIFRHLRELRDDVSREFPYVRELSMGMTADYDIAVEEGATLVRIGTALFGPRSS